jgi:hypothetical protein
LGTLVVHAEDEPHWPLELHVSVSVESAHCEAPGVHTPEHCPLTHT